MKIPAYLCISRHNIYYFRWPIAPVLHPTGLKTDIKLSLQTRCPHEALRIMRHLVYVAESVMQYPAIHKMNYEDIRDILQGHFMAERERVKARIAQYGPLLSHEIKTYKHSQSMAADALASSDYSLVGTEDNLSVIINQNELDIRQGDSEYETFRTEYVKAYRDYCESVLEYNSRFDNYKFRTDPQSLAMKKANRESRKKKLTDSIQAYVEEKIRYGNWTLKTSAGFRAQLDLMSEYLGPHATIHISTDTAHDVKRMLENIPQRARSIPKLQKMSIVELLELKDVPKISPQSINKYLQTYSAFFDWAVNRKDTDENNFKGLIVKIRNDEQARDAFTPDQIHLIMDEAIHGKKGLVKKVHEKWGVLIALYTGARLNEIAQLELTDIVQIEDIWCFSFNDDDAKTLKNVYSKRNVPIHSHLIELGILELVQGIRKAGKKRLLHELTFDKKNGYGRNLSRWFNTRLLVELGIKSPRLVFHSFRHTVIARLLQVGVDDPIVKSICGHSTGNDVTQRVYAKGYKVSQLSEAIERLQYNAV